MKKKVFLFCGLGTTGKSYWTNRVLKRVSNQRNIIVVDLDQVRIQNWGNHKLSDAEHLFKNKLALIEVQKAFVVQKAETVILNMTMLTQKKHQVPFIKMLQETQEILGKIKNGTASNPTKYSIEILALWMDCNFAATKRRIRARQINLGDTVSNVVDVAVFERDKARFEPPDGNLYPYIRVNTSNESRQADLKRQKRIFKFLRI